MRAVYLLMLVLAASVAPTKTAADEVDGHQLQGFTEPFLRVEIAVAEPGRVASVDVKKGAIVTPGQLLLSLDRSILEARLAVVTAESLNMSELQASEVQIQLAQRRVDTFRQMQQGGTTIHEMLAAEGALQIARYQRQAAAAVLEQKKLQLKEIHAQLRQREVRSSIGGVVTDVFYEVGEFVSASAPQVAVIIDQRKLRATFFLNTTEAVRLRMGQRLKVSMPGLRQTASAVVEHIGVETIANSGRVQVDLLIDNSDARYRSGVRCVLNRISLPEKSEYDRLNTARGREAEQKQ
ncbi:MAG: efflux RND transporter periplasmic adaptor subunit [Planctomycetaceae bacterium]|nr:efflux RND transporter periplasmic adaptor subunit [Planctomycetaceae bacterium]